MLDPVVLPTLYFLTVLQLVLSALVVYYAYRVTKKTGSFRAWTFVIGAFVLLTVRQVVSLMLTLALPPDQLGSLIESIGLGSTILSQAVNIAAAAMLFFGMFGLAKRFDTQPKKL